MASNDVHAAARRCHDEFIGKMRVLLHIHESDADFGKHVMKPSQLHELLISELHALLNMHAMMRGPVHIRSPATGTFTALSFDADSQPITEEQFDKERNEIIAEHEKKFEQLQSEVIACNVAMRELAAPHGLTATDLYAEINRRAGF